MRAPLLYKQKPIFGFDIGQSTAKVVQLKAGKKSPRVIGYGYAEFDPGAIENGVITKPDDIVKAVKPLLNKIVIGNLTTDRAVASIPMAHVYSRVLELGGVAQEDLTAAVELEAQQYVPLKADETYLDFSVLEKTKDDKTQVFMVAAPKKIIDSYLELFAKLDIEIHGTEPSLLSIMRAVKNSRHEDKPRIIIDFGSQSSDLAIYDKNLQLTSTASTGGDHITKCIAETLNVDIEKAQSIKARYGISKSKWQKELAAALSPLLTSLATEVQKMLRYHHDRTDTDTHIEEIVVVGGGANLPGLNEFISHLTGIEVAACNPWDNIISKPLQPPHKLETTLYTTAVGLALREVIDD